MQYSKHVIVGNKYVQEYAIKVKAPRVTILPTVVDANVYTPSGSKQNSNKPVIIGWLGSPTTVKYLSLIEAVLARVAKQASIKLMIIGGKYPLIPEVNMVCYHWPNQWSEKEEVTWLNQIDIGVMPLTDSPWEKGKCGFKLIKYMGCAKPVVASPVSSNNDIVTHGVTGYLASTEKEWEEHLLTLIYDMERSIQFGTAGRLKMLEKYSLQSTAPILHRILLDEFK
jgi:glycosyltransferase involved in cell wall biosynthesis